MQQVPFSEFKMISLSSGVSYFYDNHFYRPLSYKTRLLLATNPTIITNTTLICATKRNPKCFCRVIIRENMATLVNQHNHPSDTKRIMLLQLEERLKQADHRMETPFELAKRLHNEFILQMASQGKSLAQTFAIMPRFNTFFKKTKESAANFASQHP